VLGLVAVTLMRVGRLDRRMPPALDARLGAVERGLDGHGRALADEFARSRDDGDRTARIAREELGGAVDRLRHSLTQQHEQLRQAVDAQLNALRQENAAKLEAMRQTVDEKLQSTLEERLGASFRLVSERLDQVHRGLGEMQALASGVGDLKRVLTNVKARGTWGEVQLGSLLEQVLAQDQYAANVAVRPESNERVEFAIRLPGHDGAAGGVVWLPLDAKFPVEDYQRLCDAVERADAVAVEEAARALETRFKQSAREIAAKYVAPPHTTDFAIMFLPTEGLYAEALRRPGLADTLQRECRVLLAGPTTLWALLSSLRMGFRTLAIQERSSEVWKTLGAVKTEFARFGATLDAVKKKLDEASNKIEEVARRRRVMERTLRSVEVVPAGEAERVLQLEPSLFTLPEDEDEPPDT
jgi:DNA recombination protein RmuC